LILYNVIFNFFDLYGVGDVDVMRNSGILSMCHVDLIVRHDLLRVY